MTKKRIITLTAIGVAIVAAIVYFIVSKQNAPFNVSYSSALVEEGKIEETVTATGTIEPVTTVDVGTQVSGIVSKIYVDYNSVVKKGQVIAELDKTNLASSLRSAQSNLAAAKSELDYQTLNYKRLKTLHDKGLVSDNDYDEARLSYEKAKQSYTVQQQNVSTAQTNYGYATITSPIDGVVLSKSVEEGQTVASSFSTPTLFTIAKDLTDMRVIANVDEADIGSVVVGQRASFQVDAYPNETFEGKVTQVRINGTEESNVVTYEVVISAPNQSLKLKPSLTANITIYTLERSNVISVPSKALRFTPTKETVGPNDKIEDCEGTHKLWVREGKTFKAYAVKIGDSDGTRTEILSGIPKGTRVITDLKSEQEAPEENNSQQSTSPFMPKRPGSSNSTNSQKK